MISSWSTCHKILHILMFITSFGEQNITYKCCSNFLIHLFNRRAWDTFLDLEEDRCKTYGHPTTVIIIDLNDLKAINDKFGHSAGDQMIQKTAEILKKNVRSNDLVARLGGDEFGILNIETTLENTQKLVNRLLKSLQNAGINAAVGVAAREPSKNLRVAVIEADEKMYQHKRQIKVII
ncbi:GGDEF domain-containing protein [Acinetobacter sp. AG3]|uniref:GGDEF domain-containing protein n=1 Tax=Acinetobacter sp. AG3 TaxID=2912245 RepID=UPI0031B8AC61